MDFIEILKDYGWAAALVYIGLREIWPQTFSIFARERQKKFDADLERIKQAQEAEIQAREDDRQMRQEERRMRHELDARHVSAYERQVEQYAIQTKLLTTMTEQLSNIMNSVSTLTTFMVGYTSDMRETVGKLTGQLDIAKSDLSMVKMELARFEAKCPAFRRPEENETDE